jgi:hypothetical protein
VKSPTRTMRHLALATTVLGMAHCPAAASAHSRARHPASHLVVVTHHVTARPYVLPPAAFPDPAGLALLLNPDALALTEVADESPAAPAGRPPIVLTNIDQLRAPPIAEPESPAPSRPPATLAERLAAAAPPPIFVRPAATITVTAPPVMLAQTAPFPVPPPPPPPAPPPVAAPLVATARPLMAAVAPPPARMAATPPPVRMAATPPPVRMAAASPPVRMAMVTPPLPPRPSTPPRHVRVSGRTVATPVRAQVMLRPPRTYYYEPHYEPPPPPPYGMVIGPPRGYGYYWGGYGYY